MPPVQIVNPLTHPSWDSILAPLPGHTVFHSSAWARVLHDAYGYTPTYLLFRAPGARPAVLPLMDVRSWLTGRRGVSLPFTDEVVPLAPDADIFSALLDAARSLGRHSGWKTLELRGAQSWLAQLPNHRPSTSYWVHHLRLTDSNSAGAGHPDPAKPPGEAGLVDRFDSSTRRALRKAEASGLEVEFATSLEALRHFYGLLCLTRRRHGAPPQPWSFFAALQRHVIGPGRGVIVLARCAPDRRGTESAPYLPDGRADTPLAAADGHEGRDATPARSGVRALLGQPIAGAVYLHSGPIVHYKYGASDETFQHLRANNLVMGRAIQWHAERGFATLDFGRTSLTNEGLRRFKLGWGTTESRLDYTKFDLATGACLTAPDRTSGWHTRVFQKLPLPLSRLAGRLLYKHTA